MQIVDEHNVGEENANEQNANKYNISEQNAEVQCAEVQSLEIQRVDIQRGKTKELLNRGPVHIRIEKYLSCHQGTWSLEGSFDKPQRRCNS